MRLIQDLISDTPPPYQRRETAAPPLLPDDADDSARTRAAAAAQRFDHFLYAVFKRYCKRLLDGLDNDGNGQLSLEEFEAFLTEEPTETEAEMPVVVVSVRFAINQLHPPPPPWQGFRASDRSSVIRMLFSDLAKHVKKPIKNNHLDSRAFKKTMPDLKNMPLAVQVGKLQTWQAEAMIARFDDNASGFITFEEFEEFMQPPRSRSMLREDFRAKLAEPAFGNSCRTLVKKLDPDGNGVLSKGEIHFGLERIGLPLTNTEMDTLWDALTAWTFLHDFPNVPPSSSPPPPNARAYVNVLDFCLLQKDTEDFLSLSDNAHQGAPVAKSVAEAAAAAAAAAAAEGDEAPVTGAELGVTQWGHGAWERARDRILRILAGGYPSYRLDPDGGYPQSLLPGDSAYVGMRGVGGRAWLDHQPTTADGCHGP